MDKVVLYQSGGGLGDWLINSTLPELFHKKGYRVYLSSKAINEFKTKDTLDLLLQCPYIEGVSDEPHNIGWGGANIWESFLDWSDPKLTLVSLREYVHNFDIKNVKPIIYYQPNYRVEFADKVVCDFNFFSNRSFYNFEKVNQFIVNNKDFVYLNLKGDFPNNEIYNTKGIFEYIDILYSCKNFKCIYSGGSVLSSAISRFKSNLNVDCFMPDYFGEGGFNYKSNNWTIFRFPDINYNNYF